MVHIFPNWLGSLLSIGLLCDAGCTATFDVDQVIITDKERNDLLSGHRSSETRMWIIDLEKPPAICAVVITEPQGTQANVIEF